MCEFQLYSNEIPRIMKSNHKILITSLLFLIGIAFACEKNEITTGLEGTVFKGPINPVEIVGQVNDAPFAAEFHVYDAKDKFVKSFLSDESGSYSVMLEPGDFKIIPDQTTPVIMPEHQVKEITIDGGNVKKQDLYFDTGIR